jgi:hypothetical protein
MGALHYGRGAWIVIRAGAIILVLTVARTSLTLWVFFYRAVSYLYFRQPGRSSNPSIYKEYILRGFAIPER